LGAPGDGATSGIWILADPVGTVYEGYVIQPEDDHTDVPGVQCFVTGNGSPGGAAGEADVDGGTTTLLTPVFDLSRVQNATVEYWVWYTNDRGNNPGQDTWAVQVTGDGVNWTNLESTTTSTNAWVRRTFDLGSYLPLSDRVQLRFVADDQPSGSLVEAAIDDFVLTVIEPTSAADGPVAAMAFALEGLRPNPSPGAAELRFRTPVRGQVDVQLFDVSGRLVRTLWRGTAEPGEHRVSWNGLSDQGRRVASGVYFLRMQADGFLQVRQVAIVE
jgi:hypothetical protein